MKRRRYHLTEDKARAVIAALAFVLMELKEYEELSAREVNQIATLETIKNRLESYQWWI